jgi:hypothetical protein
MMVQAADMFGQRERAEHVARVWVEGRSLIWSTSGKDPHYVAVGVVRFADTAGARAYQGLAIDLQRKQDEWFGTAGKGPWRVLSSQSSTVCLAGAEEAVRIDKQLQFGVDNHAYTKATSVVLVRAGSLIFEITWDGLPTDPAWAERVVKAVLAGGQQP